MADTKPERERVQGWYLCVAEDGRRFRWHWFAFKWLQSICGVAGTWRQTSTDPIEDGEPTPEPAYPVCKRCQREWSRAAATLPNRGRFTK